MPFRKRRRNPDANAIHNNLICSTDDCIRALNQFVQSVVDSSSVDIHRTTNMDNPGYATGEESSIEKNTP